MGNRKEIHERVLNAKSTDELMEAYSQWAEKYDSDLLGEMGYVAPMITADLLAGHLVDKSSHILDAGCGTGIVGRQLHQRGYRNIQGLDYSPDMLKQADKKGVYQKLSQADLTRPLCFTDDTFDAVICVGTFTCGHVGPVAFDELLRITKNGGYICFSVRDSAWDEDGFAARMTELEQSGLWKLKQQNTEDYIRQEGASCKVCLYRTCG